MNDHDHSYKRLFSHRAMVEDLLRGFVNEDWVSHLDFSTLEKVNASFVSDRHQDRAGDVIWKVRWGRQWLYVYLLIEFQSTVDVYMAVRMMVYVGLLYQDLIDSRQVQRGEPLPPVLPLVLYNGSPRWTAAEEVGDLIQTLPGGLERYGPKLRYLLLDEGRYTDEQLGPMRNLTAAVFRLENSRRPEAIRAVLDALAIWLDDPGQAGLRRDIATWVQRVVLRRHAPDSDFPEVAELREVSNMLAERVAEWERQWKEEGRKEGLKEGRKAGRKEGRKEGMRQGERQGVQAGEASVLLRLLQRRFGPLSDEQQATIQSTDADTLLLWSDRVLTARTLDEVMGPTDEAKEP